MCDITNAPVIKDREAFKRKMQEKIRLRREWMKKHYIKTEDLKNPPRYDDVYYKGSAEWVL